jgi:arginyl-tRNA synthetase
VRAVEAAVRAGELAEFRSGGMVDVSLRVAGAGIYTTPVALRVAAAGRCDAREVAGVIGKRLARTPGLADVTIEGSGFLKITVTDRCALAAEIVEAGASYALADSPRGGWPDRPRTFENPGFSVRYAYARAAATLRHAHDLDVPGKAPGTEPTVASNDQSRADAHFDRAAEWPAAQELELLARLGELPSRAQQAERERRATPLMRHLKEIADAYHDVYEQCPALPQGDEKPGAAHARRVTLADATCVALRNGLLMIGEDPRERI